jgi:hypothetical protein
MLPSTSLFERAQELQNLLVSHATGARADDGEYTRLRALFMEQSTLLPLVPAIVRTNRNLNQFWQAIKVLHDTYEKRRRFLWDAFEPLLAHLEGAQRAPSDTLVSAQIERFDAQHVQAAWSKALERRTLDPEGALTSARTLLESVCKHILEQAQIPFGDSPDITKLYRLASEHLNCAPSQHTEVLFKQILGACTTVVEGLGALRNRLSDAHGKGAAAVKPAPRHAELAVNLAGTMALFLLSTYEARKSK